VVARALIVALALCACGKTTTTQQVTSEPKGSGTTMASGDKDIELVKKTVAQELKVSPGDVKVRVNSDAKAPGVTVFAAAVDPAKAGRNVTRTGVVDGGAIYKETEAMSHVARAWAYGAKRTVPAATVASVFAALHNATAESSAMTDPDMLDVFKSTANPKQAAAAALPKETVVDGNPAVVYCLTSSTRTTPFTVVTAIIKPDYQVELRAQPVLND
jgi:hypothetical protein